MATTTNKGYALMATNDQIGAWGAGPSHPNLNADVFTIIDNNIGGTVAKNLAGLATLSLTGSDAQQAIIVLTGTLTSNVAITTGALGYFFFDNQTVQGAYLITVTNGAGATATVPALQISLYASDSTYGVRKVSQSNPSPFPTGTVMSFFQTSAPVGWTKSTSHDDAAIRIVSGTASTGGATAFSSVFTATRQATGTVSGSAAGAVTGNAVGTVAGNASGSVSGSATGTINGNASGTVSGTTSGGTTSGTASGTVGASWSGTTDQHTLSIAEMPNHGHSVTGNNDTLISGGSGNIQSGSGLSASISGSIGIATTGGGGGHSHTFSTSFSTGASLSCSGSFAGVGFSTPATLPFTINFNATPLSVAASGTLPFSTSATLPFSTSASLPFSTGFTSNNMDFGVAYVDCILATAN